MLTLGIKDRRPVVVVTKTHRLEGEMAVVPGGRLIDELNKRRSFIPLTNVSIFEVQGTDPLGRMDFVAVQKKLVIMVAPLPT